MNRPLRIVGLPFKVAYGLIGYGVVLAVNTFELLSPRATGEFEMNIRTGEWRWPLFDAVTGLKTVWGP